MNLPMDTTNPCLKPFLPIEQSEPQFITSESNIEFKQIDLEEKARTKAIDKYRQGVQEAKEKQQTDSTAPGRTLLVQSIGHVEAALVSFLKDARSGKPGRRSRAVEPLSQLPTDVAAVIALRVILGGLTENKRKLNALAVSIGSRLDEERQLLDVKEKDKKKYDAIVKQGKERVSMRNRKIFAMTAAHQMPDLVPPWTTERRVQAGSAMIELIVKSTGLISIEPMKDGRKYRENMVVPTKKVEPWLAHAHVARELLCYSYPR